MTSFTPREIVSELDRFIVGQKTAKRAVAIALRNRWRRQQIKGALKDEVLPKNILMIGPTGVGKTEIARRLAKLADAPFIKVEATKFTEVGYVGRDVEQIIRDLLEISINNNRESLKNEIKAKAEVNAEKRVIEALVGSSATNQTKEKYKKMLRDGQLDNQEIEVELASKTSSPLKSMEIPGISKDVLFPPASLTAISISLSSKSPLLNLFLKLSRVAGVAFFPTRASKTFSSASFYAWA